MAKIQTCGVAFLAFTMASGLKLNASFASQTIGMSYYPTLVTQAFLDDRCPEKAVYLLGTTQSYTITICGRRRTGTPTHFLGELKQDKSSFLLPLRSYTETRFVASGKKHTYILDLKQGTLTIQTPGQPLRVEKFVLDEP